MFRLSGDSLDSPWVPRRSLAEEDSPSSLNVTPFSNAFLTSSSSDVLEFLTSEEPPYCPSDPPTPFCNCSFSLLSSSCIIFSISFSSILLSESDRVRVKSGSLGSPSSSENDARVIEIRTLLGLRGLASTSSTSFSMVSACIQ